MPGWGDSDGLVVVRGPPSTVHDLRGGLLEYRVFRTHSHRRVLARVLTDYGKQYLWPLIG